LRFQTDLIWFRLLPLDFEFTNIESCFTKKKPMPLFDSGLKTAVRETSIQNQGDLGV
jgi:hypothetical protein